MRNTLFVLGSQNDVNLTYLLGTCLRADVPTRWIDLEDLTRDGEWEIAPEQGMASISTRDDVVDLAGAVGVFWRPVQPISASGLKGRRWRDLIGALSRWLDGAPDRPPVVNPAGSHRHNRSRPVHESMLRAWGFDVPDSVTSADPGVLRSFLATGAAIRKSITGRHREVRDVSVEDLERRSPESPPWHLQRRVEGTDVRVHVVAGRCFPLSVRHRSVDYHRSGLETAEIRTVDLPDLLADRLGAATTAQGLVFAGWDLRRDQTGRYWCFECNPMPAFAGFDRRAGRQVAEALVDVLTAGASSAAADDPSGLVPAGVAPDPELADA